MSVYAVGWDAEWVWIRTVQGIVEIECGVLMQICLDPYRRCIFVFVTCFC